MGINPGDSSAPEIVAALLADPAFEFRESGQYLNRGICPECGKKELFISKDNPWRLSCNRQNRCGWSESTRELYPHLFNRYAERCPATPENPKATADAYLAHNRRFDLEVIGDWYSQERYRIPRTDRVAETIRFYIDADKTRYWERLIDQTKDDGQRINFGGRRKADGSLVLGEWWMPPGQKIEAGDEVYLVEGIFHAIAFHLSGYKACALLMAGNFPSLSIEPYGGRAVRWRLALDDDKAGRSYMLSHRKKLRELGERAEVVLTGTKKDWDDLYRLDRINDKFLGEALWRGRMFSAKSVSYKAWAWYAWKRYPRAVIDFDNRLYSVRVDDKLGNELANLGVKIGDLEAMETFAQHAEIYAISDCHPRFLYCEEYKLTGEISYFFEVDFHNHNPSVQVSFPGAGIESAASFNKSLLSRAASATFDGSADQYRLLRRRWFRKKTLHIEKVPFVGYDRDSKAWLFQSWAVHKNKELQLNEHGFFMAGEKPVKTGFGSFVIQRGESDHRTGWFADFMTAFHWNGMVALSFWFGSYFAEQIRRELKSYPFLELTGEHGSGKSTLIEFLWKLSGREDYEGFDPSTATPSGFRRNFMHVSNLPIVLIESDREVQQKSHHRQFNFEELKKLYNGRAIRTTGVRNLGNETEEPPFRGSIVIAQNAEVEGSPALLSRIVQCRCTKEHFTSQSEKIAAGFEKASVEEYAGFMLAALLKESVILEIFLKQYSIFSAHFGNLPEVKDSRIVKTHATVMACAMAMREVIPELTAHHLDCLRDFLSVRAIERQKSLNQDHPVVQSFWETYDLIHETEIAGSGMVKPSAKEHLNHSPSSGEIWINLTQFYQFCMENHVETISKADMRKYLPGSRSRKFVGQKTVRSNLLNRPLWCWIFKDGR